MRIAPLTRSVSVQRALESMVTQSGHTPAIEGEAELLLVDTLHPDAAKKSSATPQLLLGKGDFPCPLHPNQLIRHLTTLHLASTLPLAHGWTLDVKARQLTHPQSPALMLTEKECALLCQLLTTSTQTLTREALLAAVWGVAAEDIDTHTLETHIYRLRSKLEALHPSPGDIITDSGTYRILTKG